MKTRYNKLIYAFCLLLSAYFCGVYFPWWVLMIFSFLLSAFFRLSLGFSFSLALIVTTPVWYFISQGIQNSSGSDLLIMVGELLMGLSMNQLFLVTGLIGGITAGLGALAGSSIRQLW
ncbi:MAG: hypothetical protein IPM48_13840 [Saprospiraceae bacterium]|nr:hypothetical protein [Saprospiraceae bacterium]